MYTDRSNLKRGAGLLALLVLASAVLVCAGVPDGAAAPAASVMTLEQEPAMALASPRAAAAIDAHQAAIAGLKLFGLPLRTIFLLAHVTALAVGMGGALLLDGYLFGYLYRRAVTEHVAELATLGGRAIAAALAVLWLSGFGFLLQYALENPEKLANPKLWAKVSIVAILTANGYLIHRTILARVQTCIGKPLLAGLSLATAQPILMLGTISGVSWLTAFVLGMVRELNDVVAAPKILTVYVALLVATNMIAAAVHQRASRAPSKREVVARPMLEPARTRERPSAGARSIPQHRLAAVLRPRAAAA